MSTPEGDYMPTTDEIREQLLWDIPAKDEQRAADAFDRWLASHDAATRVAALEEAALWIENTRINGAYPEYADEYEMADAFRAAKEETP